MEENRKVNFSINLLTLCLYMVVLPSPAHVTNVTLTAASLQSPSGESAVPGAKNTSQRIVINSESTNIQVVPSGQSCDAGHAALAARLAVVEARLDNSRSAETELSALRTELTAVSTQLMEVVGKVSKASAGGSVYVRWGGQTCPQSSETLYSGVIGGSFYDHRGAAANALCLPLNPVYDGHPVPATSRATHLYGAEYKVSPQSKHNQDPLCSVCVSPRPHTVMIPGTNTCHPGWIVEYTGYIMAGYYDHPAATEFICMDSTQDARVGSHQNHNGRLFYYTVGKCGSLPCPPYQDNKIITCVVCSNQSCETDQALAARVTSTETELSAIRTELTAVSTRLMDVVEKVSKAGTGGSVYVRWGGQACPQSAETLYSGVMGGSSHYHQGAAANALCLPLNPVYDSHPLSASGLTHLYGAEYQVNPESKHDQDPLCSVCVSPRPHIVMIPGTNTCHPGWTVEYTGYIMAGFYNFAAATEFICMDSTQDARVGSHQNHDGNLFYYTVGKCGSLPCPPYQDNKIITCVVCSK